MSLELRYALSFPWDYYRGRRAAAKPCQPRGGRPTLYERYVVFDLRTSQILCDLGRYLYVLAEAFRQAGVGVQVVPHRKFIARAGRKHFGRAALSLANVQLQWLQSRRVSPVGCLSDHDPAHTPLIFGGTHVEGADIFPYPMHPTAYAAEDGTAGLGELRCIRKVTSRPHIFFSGNFNHKYDSKTLARKFGVVTRAQIIAALQQEFPRRMLPQQETYTELQSLQGASTMPDLIINHSKKCPIPHERWLETVARFDFFLCCPGVSHPFCHNAIEAMSVGTIPIIEFPDLFSPPLQDGVNAITFRGLQGLFTAVDRALNLPAGK